MPIIFTDTHLFNPIEAIIFLSAVFLPSLFYAPVCNDNWRDHPGKNGYLFLPIVWWITAAWRCTANTGHKLWGAATRAVTIYFLLELVLRFFISTQYPNTFFDCRLLVLEYGDCL